MYAHGGMVMVGGWLLARPQDSLWDGAHDARLTGDVVDETPRGCIYTVTARLARAACALPLATPRASKA